VVADEVQSWSWHPCRKALHELQRRHHHVMEQGEGWKLMVAPGVQHLGVNDPQDTQWLLAKQTPHPASTYTNPVQPPNGGYARFDRTYIDCTQPVLVTINSTKERIKKESGWKYTTLRTGHLPMVTMPTELTQILMNA
jgi:hypothetical protein